MNTMLARSETPATEELELVVFCAGGLLLGVEAREIDHIYRCLRLTPVPLAAAHVRGVANVRGEIMTVLDLGVILGSGPTAIGAGAAGLIVRCDGERVGVLVDRVIDALRTSRNKIDNVPANVRGVDGRFLRGACQLERGLLFLLDLEQTLVATSAGRQPSGTGNVKQPNSKHTPLTAHRGQDQ